MSRYQRPLQYRLICTTAATSSGSAKKDPISILKKERAQNLTIAKRRIGYTPVVVAKFIENTDLVGMPGEQCELLLRGDLGIPTKEEVDSIIYALLLMRLIYHKAAIERIIL